MDFITINNPNAKLKIIKDIDAQFNLMFLGLSGKNYSYNKNINNKDEKAYQILIDVYSYLFKQYNFIADVGLAIVSHSNSYEKMIMIFDKNTLEKIKNRQFNDNGYISNNPNDKEILYPLRKLFAKAKIYTISIRKNGFKINYSQKHTNKLYSYMKKHQFENYYEELRTEENYTYYLEIKDKIFNCAINNNLQCIKDYISYDYNINVMDSKNKQTPLIYASANGYFNMVKFMLDNGANPNMHQKGFENAYLSAERQGFNKIAKLLKPISTMTNRPKVSSLSYSISDLKHTCIAITKHTETSCWNIKDKDMQNFCLGVTKFPTNCYKIRNSDLRKVCTAKTVNQVDCYSIKDKNMQNFCIGITKSSTNCYQINDNKLQKYCIAISKNNYNGCF